MARVNNKYENNGNLIIVRSATKDENKKDVPAHFFSSRKVGEEWVRDTDTFTGITGDITQISVDSFEHAGSIQKIAKILLKDKEANEAYLLDLRFNILNRSIFNSLCSLKTTDGVSISVYTNPKGYPAASIKQNGERVSWKFQIADIPIAEKILHPKTKQVVATDFSEVDNFFEDALIQLAKELNVAPKNKEVSSPKDSEQAEDDVW